MYDSIDIIARHRGVIGIRKLLSSNLDYTRSILDLPIIPKLIDFLKEDAYPQIQFEAAWALTNIMSGQSAHCYLVTQKGVIPILLDLINRGSNQYIIQQAIWAIGNLAADSAQNRNNITNNEGIQVILDRTERATSCQIIKLGCWAISNILRMHPYMKISSSIFESYCNKVVKIFGILGDCMQGVIISLNIYQNQKSNYRQILLNSGLLNQLILYLKSKNNINFLSILKLLCNLSQKSNSRYRQLFGDQNLLNRLYQFVLNEKQVSLMQVSLLILKNLSINECKFAKNIIMKQNLLIKLLDLLNNGIQNSRIYAIDLLLTFSNHKQIQSISFYINQKILQSLFDLLMELTSDRFKIAALTCIYKLLRLGQRQIYENNQQNPFYAIIIRNRLYVQYLQRLQYYESNEIYQWVHKILQQYFQIEEAFL